MEENVNIILENVVQLIREEDDDYNKIESALVLNPSLTWIKFILTDDKPNGNKFRLDKSAFPDLIKSGIYMPIKVAEGKISDGHDGTTPVGVITDLIEDGNKIKGIGALWGEERPREISMLKQLQEEGRPINISWEILYKDYEEEDNGVKAVKKDAVLLAATIVGRPAYAGRTPVLEIAEKHEKEDDEVEDLEKIKALNEELSIQKEDLEKQLASFKEEFENLSTRIKDLEKELEELRTYKEARERQDLENTRFSEIKKKFIEAGIDKGDEFFEEKRDYLLSMSEEVLEFLLKEMVNFKGAEASIKNPSVPNIPNKKSITELTPSEIARKLKELKKEK